MSGQDQAIDLDKVEINPTIQKIQEVVPQKRGPSKIKLLQDEIEQLKTTIKNLQKDLTEHEFRSKRKDEKLAALIELEKSRKDQLR